jgi:ATP-dependent 26S proteasome regulatory subunit
MVSYMGKKYLKLSVVDADDDSKVERVWDIDLDSRGAIIISLLGRAIDDAIASIKNNEKNDRFYESIGKPNPDNWKP